MPDRTSQNKPINILIIRYAVKYPVLVNMRRQRQLHQNPVNGRVCVECADGVQDLSLREQAGPKITKVKKI